MASPSVAIATLCDANFRSFAHVVRDNRREYCRRFNYELQWFEETLDASRPVSWSKIPAILSVMGSFEWTCWIDGDALIMDLRRGLSGFFDEASDLVISRHPRGDLQCGVMFIRRSKWARMFLEEAYAQDSFIRSSDWDQSAINYLYDKSKEHREKIKVLPIEHVQSVPEELRDHVAEWKMGRVYERGDFILHCYRPCNKEKAILEYAKRVIR